MSQQPGPRDTVGGTTLDVLSNAPRYNEWQVQVLRPYIGKRILEVGSGVGNISAELLSLAPDHLTLTDIDPWYRQRLVDRFGLDNRVSVEELVLPDHETGPRFMDRSLDTVVALNVVEHIEDDIGAVRSMREAVKPGGKVIILVPALQAIYGRMDEALGHYRRYDKRSLGRVLRDAGLTVERLLWFNRAGVPGWWFHGKVRGQAMVSSAGVRAFDRLVPVFRFERFLPLPFGQSVIGIGSRPVE